jgi:group I intron endonuclease
MDGKIYKATNMVNGKKYIGQTIQPLSLRKKQHAHAKGMLSQAIRKYGVKNFRFEIIDHASDKDSLNKKEAFWIDFHKSMSPQGYNLTTGGDANTTFPPEVRAKMSAKAKARAHENAERLAAINRGRKASAETRAKMSKAGMGRKATEETRAKLVIARSGRDPVSDEVRAKMSESGKRRKPPSAETREKLSESLRNRAPISAETRAKLVAAKTGTIFTPESREKMAAKAKARGISPETRDKMVASRMSRKNREELSQ